MFRDEGDFHASVFILRPDDTTVLIRKNRDGQKPGRWVYPGGKKKRRKDFLQPRRGERPAETVARETPEETGLGVKRRRLIHTETLEKEDFNKHFFFYESYSLRNPRPLSDEYEEVRVFSCSELDNLEDFHPEYQDNYIRCVKPRLKQRAS